MASIAGTLIRGDTRPKVPEFIPIDVAKEQGDAIEGNLGSLPDALKLADRTNAGNTQQFLEMVERLMPGFGDIAKTIVSNIGAQVHGQLPPDVERLIGQKSAERGIARGTGGSQFDKYGAVRDLGLTSLDLIDKGLGAAQRWMAATVDRVPRMDVTSMFISPMQKIGVTQWNKTMQWNRDWLHNQIRAMPNQYEEAAAGFFDTVEETGRSFLTSWGGKQAGM